LILIKRTTPQRPTLQVCEFRSAPEDAMSTSFQQAFLLCGAIFLLSFFAIWAFWFIERLRGDSAPKVAELARDILKRSR
jgi:uncharacterized membrane protein